MKNEDNKIIVIIIIIISCVVKNSGSLSYLKRESENLMPVYGLCMPDWH